MQDLFERVRDYYYQERGRSWEQNWEPYQVESQGRWTRISSRNRDDLRRLHAAVFLFAKNGVLGQEEARAMLEEKMDLADRIRTLGSASNFTVTVDYAAVYPIMEENVTVGYDVLLRYMPEQSVCERLGRDIPLQERVRCLLRTDTPEAAARRDALGAQLVRSIAMAIQEMAHAGLHHGHISPDTLLARSSEGVTEFALQVPGLERFLKSDAEDRLVTDLYTAPELLLDPAQSFDMQTDLYAAGLLLYQLLNEGKLPFESEKVSPDEAARIRMQGAEELPLPRNGCRLLQYIARKCCAHDRSHRYADAAELLEDLRRMGSSFLTGYDPAEVVTRSERACTEAAEAAAAEEASWAEKYHALEEETARLLREKDEQLRRLHETAAQWRAYSEKYQENAKMWQNYANQLKQQVDYLQQSLQQNPQPVRQDMMAQRMASPMPADGGVKDTLNNVFSSIFGGEQNKPPMPDGDIFKMLGGK